MILRFTLNNATSGPLVIEEPDGWKDSMLKLTRSDEFHSVIESYEEQTFTFWDASYDYLVNIRDTQGFDADVSVLIEISEDETTYETIFTGLVDIENSVEVDFKKIDCPVLRNDLWTRFNNNRGTSINLQSPTDLYGNNRIVLSPVTLNLSSQEVRNIYRGLNDQDITYALTASNFYGTLDFGIIEKDEIDQKFNYPRVIGTTRPFELFAVDFAGSYTFESEIYLSTGTGPFGGGLNQVANIEVYFQINDDAVITFTKTNQGVNGTDGRTKFDYLATHSLEVGDFIRIYIQNTSGGSNQVVWLDFYTSFLEVTGDTTYTDTTTQAIMIHEAFQSALDRIIGADNTLYSEYIGAQDTQQTDYVSNGCASLCAIMKGLHIRQYTLTEKPLYDSFDDIWQGHNPIFNLGLGYEIVDGTEVIRIEDKAYFYDTTTSLNLDFVNNIEVSINSEGVYKNIKIGYQKWESENANGIDDPQTKHEYAVALKKSGTSIDLYSSFIAASLAIEFTRREVKKTKDWRLDNDTFIIAIDKDIIGSPALVYEPELSGPFVSVSNLNNYTTRYNLRLTPARNFLRWRNVFNSGLQLYTSYDYKFVSGEGNVDMVSIVGNDSCVSGNVAEDQDFDVTRNALHDNVIYEFDHPLTWTEYKTIRNNRHQAIGVSSTNTGHEGFFIKSLEYSIHDALGKFRLVKAINIALYSFTISGSLTETVSGSPEWSVEFFNGLATSILPTLIGNSSTGTTMNFYDSIVECDVNKITSGGLTLGNTTILFKVNGVTVNTVNITSGQAGIGSYTFTGLLGGESLSVEITEG